MSYLSFENNIIEASGSLILKSTSGSIDCSGATISNVIVNGTIAGSDKIKVTSIEASLNDISFNNSNLLDVSSIQVNNDVSCASLTVDTIGFENHDISFNNSNLLDVSSIQVNNDVSCASLFVNNISSNSDTIFIEKDVIIDGSLSIQTGELTLIKTKDLDISDNIIGLNRGHIGANNTSGMLINYGDASNIFFGYHDGENAFVIAHTDSSHNESSITLDSNYVDLKVGRIDSYFDTSGTEINTGISSSNIPNDNLFNDISYCKIGESSWKSYFNDNLDNVINENGNFSINVPHFDNDSSNNTNLQEAPIIFKTSNSFAFMINNNKCLHLNKDGRIFFNGDWIDFIHREVRITTNTEDSVGGRMYLQSNNKVIFSHYKGGGGSLTIDISNQKIEGDYDMSCSSLTVDTIGFENHDISFNNSNLLDVSSILVKNQVQAFSFNATSDYRTKTNIEELDENITVSNLRPLVYLKNGQKEIGLLAHELQEVYPFMVCGEKDGKEMQSVNYNGLIGVLINDVKRLSNENKILKLNNDTLKSRLDSLEEKFNKKFE